MKANELMIGDWVIVNTYPEKVKLIGETLIKVWNRDNSIDVDDVSPIPLTAEILANNDFLHRESDAWGEVYTYKWSIEQEDKALEYEHNFNLSPDPYEGTSFYWIPEMSAVPALCIKYVHELQHLMRFCGIEKEIEL